MTVTVSIYSFLIDSKYMTTPHDSPALFRLESTITDLLEQEARNSGFESKQETVAVTVFFRSRKRQIRNFT